MMVYDPIFDFISLGEIKAQIGGIPYCIKVDYCKHGVRLKTTKLFTIEDAGNVFEKNKVVYFGEGDWLSLPTIEEAVLGTLEGTEEEVEEVCLKYDEIMATSLPELITGNMLTGFAKRELERLKSCE